MLNVLSGQLGDRFLAPVGTHCILELYDCPAAQLNDADLIKHSLREAAKKANATLLNEVMHQFEPQGITALALLSESHISIHTWPENGYAAVDVFTCGQHTDPEMACLYLVRAMQAGTYAVRKLPRQSETPLTSSFTIAAHALEASSPSPREMVASGIE
ncbi:adenosylmethionine decarboxylase [Synechococcales cyanobacterium C]|uniref:S-adenosylmethionine decarboxylase proenzyme n=1 Tax=Petrachloros mirabilis ULC683 TaxID=2781853 RepID=A0A8K1ZXY1_9CYAN|nr:adenosylmethionine decarboxylase [Petrachloros mirabilis]NCJ06148.1 adenosylmethionine decarboxylase [Petrachloros mirabilis ULC683]